jgi:hypothetical protein
MKGLFLWEEMKKKRLLVFARVGDKEQQERWKC